MYSKETHTPVIDNTTKKLVFDHGKLVLHEKLTNTIVYADLTEKLVETYNLSKYLKIIPSQNDNQPSTTNAVKKLCTGDNVVLNKEQLTQTLPAPVQQPLKPLKPLQPLQPLQQQLQQLQPLQQQLQQLQQLQQQKQQLQQLQLLLLQQPLPQQPLAQQPLTQQPLTQQPLLQQPLPQQPLPQQPLPRKLLPRQLLPRQLLPRQLLPLHRIAEKDIIECTKKKFIVMNPNTGQVMAVMNTDDRKPNGTTVTSSTSSTSSLLNTSNPSNPSNTSSTNTINQASGSNSGVVSSTETTRKRAVWTTDATLDLIVCYRQIDALNIRDESIWQKINEAMESKNYSFTSTQCKDRFYYLKNEYAKKLESTKSDSNSEIEEITFNYFDEFNDIFGMRPSAIPEYAVSSRRSCLLSVEELPKHDKPAPKCKKKNLTNTDNLFEKTNQNRDERREIRHRERIELKKKAISELKIATELLKRALENKI